MGTTQNSLATATNPPKENWLPCQSVETSGRAVWFPSLVRIRIRLGIEYPRRYRAQTILAVHREITIVKEDHAVRVNSTAISTMGKLQTTEVAKVLTEMAKFFKPPKWPNSSNHRGGQVIKPPKWPSSSNHRVARVFKPPKWPNSSHHRSG